MPILTQLLLTSALLIAEPPSKPADPAPAKALTAEEQAFVGRWQIDFDKYLAEVIKDPARFGLNRDIDQARYQDQVLSLFPQVVVPTYTLRADHTALITPTGDRGTWQLADGKVQIKADGTYPPRSLRKNADGTVVFFGFMDTEAPAKKTTPGPTLTPENLQGEWEIDKEASSKATRTLRLSIAQHLSKVADERKAVLIEAPAQAIRHIPFGLKFEPSPDGKGTKASIWYADSGSTPATADIEGDILLITPEPVKEASDPTSAKPKAKAPKLVFTAEGETLRTTHWDAEFLLKRKQPGAPAPNPAAAPDPKPTTQPAAR